MKNPWYTELIIKNALKNKGIELEKSLTDEDFEIELNSLRTIKKFIEQKEEKDVSGN